MLVIRSVTPADSDALWAILEPVIRAGETYALDRDMPRDAALDWWAGPGREAFVAEEEGRVVGTYYLRANHAGGGSHVANAGYAVASRATGRGVARAMCAHSLEKARAREFRAMQFNFVVSTNVAAAHLWQAMGFAIAGTIPRGFQHPAHGYVDAYMMYRAL